jgi:uncharacterized protein YndB with AHSA1/START domain
MAQAKRGAAKVRTESKAKSSQKKVPVKRAPAKKISKKASKAPAKKTLKGVSASKKRVKVPVRRAPAKKILKRGSSSSSSKKGAGKHVFETVQQVVHFSAPPEVIYRAWLDSRQHAEFTGVAAKVEARVGGAFSSWDNFIHGKLLELVPNERIVQTWRATDFPPGYPDSRMELTLVPESGGTRLCLLHQSLPKQKAKQYEEGWNEFYWRRLRAYLAQREA